MLHKIILRSLFSSHILPFDENKIYIVEFYVKAFLEANIIITLIPPTVKMGVLSIFHHIEHYKIM